MDDAELVRQHTADLDRIAKLTKDYEALGTDYDNLFNHYNTLKEELDTLKSSIIPHIQAEIAKATSTLAVKPAGPAPKKRGNRMKW